jgi:hypothetical protein
VRTGGDGGDRRDRGCRAGLIWRCHRLAPRSSTARDFGWIRPDAHILPWPSG